MTDAGGRIVVSGVTKVFGTLRAVDDLSFTVEPGTVTAFLGPNGAGKTTTMRVMLGLAQPTSGTATVAGLPYTDALGHTSAGRRHGLPSTVSSRKARTVWYQSRAFCGLRIQWFSSG